MFIVVLMIHALAITFAYFRLGATNMSASAILILATLVSYHLICHIVLGRLTWLGCCYGLRKIGFTNKRDQIPLLLFQKQLKSGQFILQFYNCSIPLERWLNKKDDLESGLNLRILSIKTGYSLNHIVITAISGKTNLPDAVAWNEKYLLTDDFVLSLGFGFCGLLTINLSKTPHILIGGSTGSGKTILLKNILLQSVSKGALVYIADFKGGVDFPQWHQFSYFITNKQDFSQLLDCMALELSHRKQRFCTVGVANIGEYNLHHPPLQRLMVACDEIAELLDKSGLNKADRELVCEIEGKLATIARQGRAFGLHLVLATQRPDASILPGQIRNNMDIRICGRADNILSQMILDTTDASTLIPKDAQGRFLTNEGTLFQGFWDNRNHFKEEMNHESSKNQRLPRYIDH